MKAVVTNKWILCPVCKAKTRTQILDDFIYVTGEL
ncbi:cysteine-rich KTR domain-containing protein [uncultured Eubacterium sp.]